MPALYDGVATAAPNGYVELCDSYVDAPPLQDRPYLEPVPVQRPSVASVYEYDAQPTASASSYS